MVMITDAVSMNEEQQQLREHRCYLTNLKRINFLALQKRDGPCYEFMHEISQKLIIWQYW